MGNAQAKKQCLRVHCGSAVARVAFYPAPSPTFGDSLRVAVTDALGLDAEEARRLSFTDAEGAYVALTHTIPDGTDLWVRLRRAPPRPRKRPIAARGGGRHLPDGVWELVLSYAGVARPRRRELALLGGAAAGPVLKVRIEAVEAAGGRGALVAVRRGRASAAAEKDRSCAALDLWQARASSARFLGTFAPAAADGAVLLEHAVAADVRGPFVVAVLANRGPAQDTEDTASRPGVRVRLRSSVWLERWDLKQDCGRHGRWHRQRRADRDRDRDRDPNPTLRPNPDAQSPAAARSAALAAAAAPADAAAGLCVSGGRAALCLPDRGEVHLFDARELRRTHAPASARRPRAAARSRARSAATRRSCAARRTASPCGAPPTAAASTRRSPRAPRGRRRGSRRWTAAARTTRGCRTGRGASASSARATATAAS